MPAKPQDHGKDLHLTVTDDSNQGANTAIKRLLPDQNSVAQPFMIGEM